METLSDLKTRSLLGKLAAVISAAGILAAEDDMAKAVKVAREIKSPFDREIADARSYEDFRRVFLRVLRAVVADMEGRESAKAN